MSKVYHTLNNRNYKVEFIRILACVAVVCYHIRILPWKIDGQLSETAVFFEAVCTICVMTFFLITGFYIYNKDGNIFNGWVSLIKKFVFQVFCPTIIVTVITLIFHNYFISTKSFIECIKDISIKYIFNSLFNAIIHLDMNYLPGTAAHLWYVISYGIVIFAYPVTRFILTKTNKKFVYGLLILFTFLMIVNDYFLFYNNKTYNIVFKIVHKPIFYSAWGYVLYNNIIKKYIDNIKNINDSLIVNKYIFFISCIVYVITFILLFKTQVNYYLTTNAGYVYTSWLSTYSLILTTCFILIVYNINFKKFFIDRTYLVISFISSKTFKIYLIHYLIITKLLSIGFQNIFASKLPSFSYQLAYYLIYTLFIFIITLIFVCLLDKLFSKIKILLRGSLCQKEKII